MPSLEAMQKGLEHLFEQGVLVDLDIGFWRGLKKNNAEELGIDPKDVPEYVVGLGMKRLIPKSAVKNWSKAANSARFIVQRYSIGGFPLGGARFVPLTALAKLEADLRERQDNFEKGWRGFINQYDGLRRDMVKKHPVLDGLYPSKSELESKFYFSWALYEVTLPKQLGRRAAQRRKVDAQAAAMERQQRELDERIGRFLDEAVSALRGRVVEIVESIVSRIKSGEVITERSLNSLRRFTERFKMLNFVGDERMEKELDRMLGEMKSAAEYKDDKKATNALLQSLNQLRGVAASVSDVSEVTGSYRRKIEL